MALTVEQLVARKKYIGGTDAPAILGLSRWKTVLQVWAEKTGTLPDPDLSDSLPVKLGMRLEEVVAELFTERTGKKVRRANETIIHKAYPFLGANIDRRVVGEDAIVECKTTSAWKAKEWDGEEIPHEYIIQVMHYLGVTGMRKAYLAVLIGNQDFRIKEIERDEKLISDMIDREVYFWNQFVVPKVMPAQISAKDAETLYALFPVENQGASIELGDDGAKLIEMRNSLYQDQISVEKQIDRLENEIKARLGTNETGRAGKWCVTWRSQVTKRLDSKTIKLERPDIYEAFAKESASRVMRIKEITHG